jgi:hypothetical protein
MAHLLAKWSWDPAKPEELSHERVQAILGLIAEYHTRDAFRLRRLYERSLALWFRYHCVEIEYCGPYDVAFFEQLRDKIQTAVAHPLGYVVRENPQLLAGFRVRYGDGVWSRNVRDSLDVFRDAIALGK